jgi:HAD superfamily hydrolase (TIGR01509 family)
LSETAPENSKIHRPRAILFDMDGTITEPMLDFPRIKAAMGIGRRPILEALAEMDCDARAAAEAILHEHEEQAAGASQLNAGCACLIEWVRSARLRTALITRNSRRSVKSVLAKHGLSFEVLITREDGKFKPHPEPLHVACQRLGVRVDEAWMVGDGVYDVAAGNAAGVRTVWVSHGRQREFEPVPWRTVNDLSELLTFLLNTGCQPVPQT